MKRAFTLATALVAMFCLMAADGSAKEKGRSKANPKTKFMTPAQVSKDIKFYYKDVLERRVNRINLLEIMRAEDDSELIYVYYIIDRYPKEFKNNKGHITADRAPVKVATYQFSLLKNKWTIKRVDEDYQGDYVFRDV